MERGDQSEASFSVLLLGRGGLVYERAGRLACIDGEGLAGEPCRYVVVIDSITHWDSPRRVPLTDEERKIIIQHLKREFSQQGCELILECRGYDSETASMYHTRIAAEMLAEYERLMGNR